MRKRAPERRLTARRALDLLVELPLDTAQLTQYVYAQMRRALVDHVRAELARKRVRRPAARLDTSPRHP